MSKRIIKKWLFWEAGSWEAVLPVISRAWDCRFCCWIYNQGPAGGCRKPSERNKIVNDALAAHQIQSISCIYSRCGQTDQDGNFTDNMKDIADCDWVIGEVVVERLDIKQSVFSEVENTGNPER